MQKKCLIVDGNSLVFRAFHALPPMNALDGTPTNAIHGFMTMLLKAVESYEADFCIIAFDEKEKTFRHKKFDAYKAGRAETPEELKIQIPLLKEILTKTGLSVLSKGGYEADDILGTLAQKCKKEGLFALLLTGDRDALQLVDENTALLYTKKGISEIHYFTEEEVKNHYGVYPRQVVDWKALMGDSSDNIPGIPKVGEKTATKLIQEYDNLENVLENADKIKGKLGESIRENKALAYLSRELARILTSVPINCDIAESKVQKLKNAKTDFSKLQLKNIIEKLDKLFKAESADSEEKSAEAEPCNIDIEEIRDEGELFKALSSLKGAEVAMFFDESSLHIADIEKEYRVVFAENQASLFSDNEGLERESLKKHLLALQDKKLVCYDAKAFFYSLDGLGIDYLIPEYDCLIISQLICPSPRKNNALPFSSASELLRLYKGLMPTLEEKGLKELYFSIEKPLSRVLFDMEKAGFMVDKEYLKRLGHGYDERIEKLKDEIFSLMGLEKFNLNSPKQLGEALFIRLGLPYPGGKTKSYSTDAETLEKIIAHHPAISKILEYRHISKLNSTYVVPLCEKADKNGRIHSSFDQAGAVTGRISSNDPNLQNIPTRSLEGREIRKAFIAKEGYILIDADYSQIELRILAHISGDENMLNAFRQNQDIHRSTASSIENVPLSEVTDEQRSAAKAVNFGIVYGISDFGLARNIGIPIWKANEFINKYFEKYPKIKDLMEELQRMAEEKGYAETLYGRRRSLPELKSKNHNLRSFAKRAAINTPIQGSAADIIKLAMIRVHERLKKEKLDAKLILQVHDELIIEAEEGIKAYVSKLLKEEMEKVVDLKLPLLADVNTGKNWYESK